MSGFKFNAKELLSSLGGLDERVDSAVHMYAEACAPKVEGEAKETAPWTDRTGDARKRLTCKVEKTPLGYRLKLAHGVDYGMWLELSNEKKYAVIEPTLKRMGKTQILPGLRNLLRRIGKVE